MRELVNGFPNFVRFFPEISNPESREAEDGSRVGR
jgi:hypothetical protein